MLAEHITVLLAGRGLCEGRRDADTENIHGFMCELVNEPYVERGGGQSRLAAVTCRFENEGVTWVRGKLDSVAADALRTTLVLRDGAVPALCGACGSSLSTTSDEAWCSNCGEVYKL